MKFIFSLLAGFFMLLLSVDVGAATQPDLTNCRCVEVSPLSILCVEMDSDINFVNAKYHEATPGESHGNMVRLCGTIGNVCTKKIRSAHKAFNKDGTLCYARQFDCAIEPLIQCDFKVGWQA